MTIALDSNILIYFFNENPEFVEAARRIVLSIQEGDVQGIASVLVLGEIMRKGNDALYRALVGIRNLSFAPVDSGIALRAAELQRKHHSLHFVDALHLATAEAYNAAEFWTNDHALAKATIPGLKIKALRQA